MLAPRPNRIPVLVPTAAAAQLLAISTTTVRRRVHDGTITGYRIDRLIRVDLDETLERLLVPIPVTRPKQCARGTPRPGTGHPN